MIKAGALEKTVLSAAHLNFTDFANASKTAVMAGKTTLKKKGLNMSDISDRVRTIVVEHLGVDGDKVVDGASFIDDLGADSLDTVELVMAFEEEFGVEIPDDAAERILTVKDAVSFLEENAA
jgi:acyl carrier protein